ncbi:MAG: GNAT family N-acetyltransferase [Planctomycetes bacterium]|nr:GNAT family N-acetyltransferase [Planctomycetota bacterium]
MSDDRTIPQLRTERLVLRPFTLADAPRVRELAGDRDVAATTLRIPHPYEEGMAEDWIKTHPERFAEGKGVAFAIVLAAEEVLIGAAGVEINRSHERGELGYWIARPYWSHGYATEAAREVVRYAFEAYDLHRIVAHYLVGNAASGRVMEKIGMRREGLLRHHVKKWCRFHDLVAYGLLRHEFDMRKSPPE